MSSLVQCNFPLTSIFDDLFSRDLFSSKNYNVPLYPKVDVVEDKDSYKISAEIPGLDKKDLTVEVKNGTLSISGEKVEKKEENGKYHYSERKYGSFRREFALPDQVDSENIHAKYDNGVLKLTLKKTEVSKQSKIEIE
jgi:HSP20 family protein